MVGTVRHVDTGRAVFSPPRTLPVPGDTAPRAQTAPNGRPFRPYVWRAAEKQREAEIAAQVAEIRALAALNRAPQLGVTVAEARQLQAQARESEARERRSPGRLAQADWPERRDGDR